jgi:hypothetical protein
METAIVSIDPVAVAGWEPIVRRLQKEDTAMWARNSMQLVRRVVFLGEFGPPSLTFARSCYAMGVEVYLLTPQAAAKAGKPPSSCLAGADSLDAELVGSPRGIEAILDYTRQVGADAITAISDTHCLWLAKNRARFDGTCKLLLPPAESLERMSSKIEQAGLAREAGFEVLPTYVIRSSADAAAIDPGSYPLCLRPASAHAVEPFFKVMQARSAEELLHYVRDVWTIRDAVVAQPFRVLPNMVVHCTSREGGELVAGTAFLVDRKFEGLALRVRPMLMPQGLEEKLALFSRNAGLSGTYHFDFLYSPTDRASYFLEVNARFGGTTDKVLWLGLDEPANCLLAYGLQGSRPTRMFGGYKAVANKRAILKHLLTALRRPPEPWDFPQESRWRSALRSLSDLFLIKDSIYDWQDLKGTIAFHLQGIIS